MKRLTILTAMMFALFTTAAQAQLRYYDASTLPLYGKAVDGTDSRYVRFPDSLKSVSRLPLWNLSRNSAGMAIRFSSNSTKIAARWTNLAVWGMNHMTDTAMRGLDLYTLDDDGRWRFANSARPADKLDNEVTIIGAMAPVEREYLLYLPLYDGVTSLEIGVDSLSSLNLPKVDSPRRDKPIVFYGTSILQGACASRAGMAFTNIISRRLDRETINLGFSGNALLDFEVAEIMAGVDAGCYVLDFVPNASREQILERAERFYRIIRDRHPGVPMIFIEDPIFPPSWLDHSIAEEVRSKNEALRTVFEELRKGGEKDIYFISSEKMIGDDGEATIDGIHFTDIGMVRYADLVCPVIERAMRRSR